MHVPSDPSDSNVGSPECGSAEPPCRGLVPWPCPRPVWERLDVPAIPTRRRFRHNFLSRLNDHGSTTRPQRNLGWIVKSQGWTNPAQFSLRRRRRRFIVHQHQL
jgi:hypothetical protein